MESIGQMDTASYLKRIGYRGSLRPGIDVLRRLHRRHLLTVPFENLDIHLGRPIILDQALFFKKIVSNRRGGYCYELNGCFAWLLKNLGFQVLMLSASVAGKNNRFSPDFDHMLLLVHLKEPWIADVGFGDLFTEPKQLNNPNPQKDNGQLYKIKNESRRRVLTRWNDDTSQWEPQYRFSLQPRKLTDFAARNRYQQTSPKSHFTQGRVISKLTRGGRISLSDRKLIVTAGKKRIEHSVKGKREFDQLLAKYFRLKVA